MVVFALGSALANRLALKLSLELRKGKQFLLLAGVRGGGNKP